MVGSPGLNNAFADSIRKFAEKADRRANLCVKKIIFDVGTALVLKSPVGNPALWKNPSSAPPGYVGGRFRANWQYGLGALNRTTTETIDKVGQVTIGRIVQAVPDRVLGTVHYLSNSLPYANRLEEGHSWRQAPAGIVLVTTLEFDPIVRAAAAEVSATA